MYEEPIVTQEIQNRHQQAMQRTTWRYALAALVTISVLLAWAHAHNEAAYWQGYSEAASRCGGTP